MSSGSFKNVNNKMCLEIIHLIYVYKKDLSLNNLQWLICHKTQPNQIIYIWTLPTFISKIFNGLQKKWAQARLKMLTIKCV